MIKFVVKTIDKIRIPLIILNLAAIGAAFYKQGKLDAISELNTTTETNN